MRGRMTATGGFKRRGSLAAVLGLALAMGLSGQAAAFQILKDQGPRGSLTINDGPSGQAARCGYAPANEHDVGYFRWMKVVPPSAYAQDTTAGRDQQKVRWFFTLQHSVNNGAWQSVGSSGKRTKIAYDDAAAAFTGLKFYYNGEFNEKLRAIVTVQWLRNGAVKGVVKYRIEWYSVKWDVGDPNYIYMDACDGAAD